ncbi:galactonate dehydratase [Monashia sp. NPDC004114]
MSGTSTSTSTMASDRIESVTTHLVAPRWIFVRVTTAAGLTGWGEAIVPKRARAVVGAVADLADNLVGHDPGRIEELATRMRQGGFFRDGPVLATAAAAVEHALWDIKGRRYGLPVHEFLGGPVRERTRLYAWVAGDRPSDPVPDVRRRVEQGFTMVKMNATAELDHIDSFDKVEAAVDRVAQIRGELGTSVDIALDFHGRVSRAMAKVLLKELEPLRPFWLEEILPPGLEDQLPSVIPAGYTVPIATGERLLNRIQFARLLRHGVVDVVQPDVSLTGIYELAKIAHLAEAYGVGVAPHCPNGPISLAASLQAGYALENVIVQEQSLGLHYNAGYAGLPTAEMHDYLLDPTLLRPEGGYLPRLTGSGLGIDIDEPAVEKSPPFRLEDPDWRHADGRVAEW